MSELIYEDRPCDCCGSNDLTEVWTYTLPARTKSRTYRWNVRNVVCARCGFAFVSPCPSASTLAAYYTDSYEYWQGQPLDYSIDNRLRVLRESLAGRQNVSFVEIGGNASERFQKAIAPLVSAYTNVEVNASCGSAVSSVGELPRASADVVAAYFVLEHLRDPILFFRSAAGLLKEDGLLIVEVPNLYVYPLNPAGLAWWEHTNHFSPLSLATLARTAGFALKTLSYHLCSRPFGFVAVFSRAGGAAAGPELSAGLPMGPCEYRLATACIEGGLHLIQQYRDQLRDVRSRIRAVCGGGGKVVVWAANKVCVDLLEGFDLPAGAIVVDSNPGKKDYCQPVPVHAPDAVRDYIRSAKLIVINSSLFADKIISFIKEDAGRSLSPDEVCIVRGAG